MADQNITALPVSDTPASSDQLLLVGATEEKLIDYDKLADAILNKLTSKNFSLDQGTMPLIRALNELNSNPALSILASHIYYSDTQVSEFGGFDNCVIDMIKNKLPKEDIVFYNAFTAGHRYLMLGYLYAGGEYGLIKFFDYLNMPITYIISSGNIEKISSDNLPGIEFLTRTITVESGKQAYDLQINATEYMIISICSEDRMGWQYTVTRGVSGTEATQNWAVCFIGNPTGTFTFKVAVLKIK